MVIFDLHISSENQAIAVANKGKLYVWNLENILHQQLHTDTGDSTSSYKPSSHFFISNHTYHSIDKLSDSLVTLLAPQNLKIFNLSKLTDKNEGKPTQLQITSSIFESKITDYFNTSVSYNKSKIIIGSAGGRVIVYDIFKQMIEKQYYSSSEKTSLVDNFNQEAISGMSIFHESVIIGTKGGQLREVDLRNFKQAGQYKIKGYQIPRVTKIVSDDRFVYAGHQDYITKWDKARLYGGAYNIGFQCSCLLKPLDELIVGGNVPKIYKISDKGIKKWDSSSKCTLSLREKDGLVYSCGVSPFIDVFNSTSRVCSLTTL